MPNLKKNQLSESSAQMLDNTWMFEGFWRSIITKTEVLWEMSDKKLVK